MDPVKHQSEITVNSFTISLAKGPVNTKYVDVSY